MNPFDLRGPDFLVFWLVGASIVVFLTMLLRTALAGPRGEDVTDAAASLSPTDVAYLAGGIERAIEAAVAGLHQRGIIETAAGGIQLAADHADAGDPVGLTEVERFVLRDLRRSGASINSIVAIAGSVDDELRVRLEAQGLLVSDRVQRTRWLWAPGLAWLCVGAIKVCVGLSRGRPVSILVVLLIGAAVALATLAKLPRISSRGTAVLDLLRGRSYGLEATASTAPDQLSGTDMALAYALFTTGCALGALTTMMPSYGRAILAAQQAASGNWSSSCSSSCGSSCGGGCGGGCGGCS